MRRARTWGGLVEGLAGIPSPLEAVSRTAQILHADTVIVRVSARVARDRHDVADAQRLVRDALARQLACAAPLDGPALQRAVLVRRFYVHERVRVAEHELQQLTLDFRRAVFEIGRRERMMG